MWRREVWWKFAAVSPKNYLNKKAEEIKLVETAGRYLFHRCSFFFIFKSFFLTGPWYASDCYSPVPLVWNLPGEERGKTTEKGGSGYEASTCLWH
jgi:hypothetical protein